MPKLAVFPKAFMQQLCKDGTMRIAEWIALAVKLDVEGLEWYAGFLEMEEKNNWQKFRHQVEDHGKSIPMLCCSPDFTHPDQAFRLLQIEKQKRWLEMSHLLGASYCRVLSGQRRPGLSVVDGIQFATECIEACLDYAQQLGITLVMENHYKDDFWEYPEFAQYSDIFCKLLANINHPNFGVNYDPSNAYLANEDPLVLLRLIAHRVLTMHASDRYVLEGGLQELRHEESGMTGYANRLRHGEIGMGLNDYDSIFSELSKVNFDGWISIEDGVEGMDQLERSVRFLRRKIAAHWPPEL